MASHHAARAARERWTRLVGRHFRLQGLRKTHLVQIQRQLHLRTHCCTVSGDPDSGGCSVSISATLRPSPSAPAVLGPQPQQPPSRRDPLRCRQPLQHATLRPSTSQPMPDANGLDGPNAPVDGELWAPTFVSATLPGWSCPAKLCLQKLPAQGRRSTSREHGVHCENATGRYVDSSAERSFIANFFN